MGIESFVYPLITFCLKFVELTLASTRIICVSKGYKKASFLISFIESIVWVGAVTVVLNNLSNFFNVLAFALGMALGSYVGILLEKKLALGLVLVRIITSKEADEMLSHLRKVGFRVTDIDAKSNYSNVKVLFATLKKKDLSELIKIIRHYNPKAFYTIEEVKEASLSIKKPDSHLIKDLFDKKSKTAD